MKIVYEDSMVQVQVDEKTSLVFVHQKIGMKWGGIVRITSDTLREVNIVGSAQVSMRP